MRHVRGRRKYSANPPPLRLLPLLLLLLLQVVLGCLRLRACLLLRYLLYCPLMRWRQRKPGRLTIAAWRR